jgi:hypothetical protein
MILDAKPQSICPICTKEFAEGDVVIQYRSWEASAAEHGNSPPPPRFGHVDCVLSLSVMEDRDHPEIFEG